MKYVLVCCLLTSLLLPQQRVATNLEMLASLVDSSFSGVSREQADKAELKIIAPGSMGVLSSYIQSSFVKRQSTGKVQTMQAAGLVYTVEEAKVTYENSLRDGLFGDINLVRKAVLHGNILTGTATINKFSFSAVDTISLQSRPAVESSSYSFLSPSVPAPPSFDAIWEPAAIIASIGVAVYLLFSVRKTD